MPHQECRATLPGGVTVVYEVYGPASSQLTPVLLTPGGGGGRGAFRWLAQRLARETGRRCIVHDRVNTGASTFTLGEQATQPEWDLQADYTHLLLHQLGLAPAILLGKSNGSRLSLVMASKYPLDVAGLVLLNVTNGAKAAKKLSKSRYYQMLDACACGGLETVAREPHFAELFEKNPENRARLLACEPGRFMLTMRCWGEMLSKAGDSKAFPVTALSASLLQSIRQPALCVYMQPSKGEDDGMHTLHAMQSLHDCLSAASGPTVVAADNDQCVAAIVPFLGSVAAPEAAPPPPAEPFVFGAREGMYPQTPPAAELAAFQSYYADAARKLAHDAEASRKSLCSFGGLCDWMYSWKRYN